MNKDNIWESHNDAQSEYCDLYDKHVLENKKYEKWAIIRLLELSQKMGVEGAWCLALDKNFINKKGKEFLFLEEDKK